MNRTLLVITCLVLGGLGASLGHWAWQVEAVKGQNNVVTAVPREITSYRSIVKKVLPAVVSIDAQSKNNKRGNDDDPSRGGFGSGFLISARGVVVTNHHVVEGAEQATVHLADGRKFTSRKIKSDPKTDLAIIELDAKQALPFLLFGDSDDMEIGDRVLAIGAPFGLAGTVTSGIISSKGRSLRMNMYEDFLQTDAAINPGNSGGPLISLEGKVIGINSAIKSRSGGFQGIGLAISSNLGKRIVDSLLKEGVVRRGYLGVGIRDVDAELAKDLGLKEASGVQVTRLFPDAPGEKGGLKSGDVILKIAGKPIKDGKLLLSVVADLPLGKPTDVEIVRSGQRQTVKVIIEEQPKNFGTAPKTSNRLPDVKNLTEVEKVGLFIADMTPEVAEALGYPDETKGVLIVTVLRKGAAGSAGLKPGLLITSIDGKAVGTAKAASAALAKGNLAKGIELEVRGPSGTKQKVTLSDSE